MVNEQPRMNELEDMIKFCKKYKNVYIWGDCHKRELLLKYLNFAGIEVTAFVVSKHDFLN